MTAMPNGAMHRKGNALQHDSAETRRTRNTFRPSRKSTNSGGHGMSYTALAEEMICIMEMPIFIMPRGARLRTANRVPNAARRSKGKPTVAATEASSSDDGPKQNNNNKETPRGWAPSQSWPLAGAQVKQRAS